MGDLNTAMALLRELREAEEARAASKQAFRSHPKRSKADKIKKEELFDVYWTALQRVIAAEEAADKFLGR
jgi:hypothetical protein